MIVKINGKPCSRADVYEYEKFTDWVDRCGYYGPIDKTRDMVLDSEFYQHTPIPPLDEFHKVQGYCGDIFDDPTCYMDSFNHMVMKATPVTEAMYKFITHKTAIIREGIDSDLFLMEGFIWTLSALV